MTDISEFCRRMQASLDKQIRATTEEERIAAIQERTEVLLKNRKGQRDASPPDFKVKQAGRED